MSSDERVSDFLANVNSTYKRSVVAYGGSFPALGIPRFSSGILSLDSALGGGWPFGRIATIAGSESTGKTLIALKACASVMEYDRSTRLHITEVPSSADFRPCVALFVDAEGAFDPVWAARNGFAMDHHVVARPETAEQAIDIVMKALYENVFDLVVVDSIAALTPSKEIDETSEKWQMGLGARLVNKAFRRWGSALNRQSQEAAMPGPSLLCLNQIRMNLSAGLFADPRTLPHGQAQNFYSSIIIMTKAAKILDGEDKSTAWGEYGGTTRKNKTYIPKLGFSFAMGLRDSRRLGMCEVDNLKRLLDLGKRYGLIVPGKGGVSFGETTAKTQKALMEMIAVDRVLLRSLWGAIVAAEVAGGRSDAEVGDGEYE